jgi:hypothetical protein
MSLVRAYWHSREKFDIRNVFEKSVEKLQIVLKSDT